MVLKVDWDQNSIEVDIACLLLNGRVMLILESISVQ